MLKMSAATMNSTRNRGPRGRSNAPDRGGIRKRGATRMDRDGDLDMDGPTGRGRGGKRSRGDSGRGTPAGGQTQGRDQRRAGPDRERTLNAIQKALTGKVDSQANIRQARGGLEQASVTGWKQSKAASNPDGGLESLVAFLEKKITPQDSKAPNSARAKITKSRVEGDSLIVSIRPELLDRMLQINGFTFAGAPLTIQRYGGATGAGEPTTADTKAKMTAFLGKRYYQQTKLLDLSNLASDPDLLEMGMFNSMSTQSKFFPALMKVWEMGFDNAKARREAVESVSLANNQLSNISVVTTLSQTFPDLKNLDLSNNAFKDAQALINWRWKFRHLEFLDLSGSPFSADPKFKDTMLRWYPRLRMLNNIEVRTAEELAAQKKTPIPVQAPYFQDDSQIAENFVKAFFVGFDNDRNDLANGIYDNSSTFSLSVNTAAPRALQSDATASWDQWIKKSRNLLKISHLPARMSRTYTGAEKIREVWNTLPKTKHPDMMAHPEDWLIECHPVPGLPDPTGQSETGVGGLLIMVHGKFDEINTSNPSKVETRSFDRTFVLGPGGGVGGLRVVNDMLCLRAYGGNEAWGPDGQSATVNPQIAQPQAAPAVPAVPAVPQPVHPQAPEGYGMPAPGKAEVQVQQEQMVLEISLKTKMTLQYSEMALSGNSWNMEAALKNFEELKTQGKLPPDAFLPGA
ncbi:hypothetical protein DTO027B5_8521 [Paecilomyces variotii]|nr:hypothetical protein DTO021C3_3885 [Paecilomyces variotii]KAJ9320235.1 hypothetical protein DTO027B3_8747 [Paecilomyces variotii]KAJ9328944.1 hypothetical protein DTO027B5_8521 [Paecilomyces variotii]KAJ9395859.1 hypothetical protein DTO282F9_7230 [Paecilomyces variotii]